MDEGGASGVCGFEFGALCLVFRVQGFGFQDLEVRIGAQPKLDPSTAAAFARGSTP